jgi:predicted nucleic acid-binding protein
MSMYARPFGAAATTNSTNDNGRRCQCIAPDLIIAEITNAAWKFVIFDGVAAAAATSAIREVAKAFEELVPTSALKDRALAIAIALRHPAYDCFYLALAERSATSLITADDRLIRRCSGSPFARLAHPL